MSEPLLGRVLRRVVYFSLPNTAWERTPGLHQIDFGLDFEFEDGVAHITWAPPNYGLKVGPGTLRNQLVAAIETINASGLPPWHELIGRSMVSSAPAAPIGRQGPLPCALRLDFSGAPQAVWLAAATYLEEDDLLVDCSDVVVVLADPLWAARWGFVGEDGPADAKRGGWPRWMKRLLRG